MKLNYKIRKFEPKDTKAIKNICADTGFLGEKIDTLFSDRELFTQLIRNYYLKHEPEHILIAESKGKVVGYLFGSLKPNAHFYILLNQIIVMIKILFSFLIGKYKKYPQNKKFIKYLLTKAPFELVKTPKNYAHAHFNIIKKYRHKGIGTDLIKTALKQLSNKIKKYKIKGLYGEVFSYAHKSEAYFEKAGFKIYDKKKTNFLKDKIKGNVYVLCITKKLF
ncbi:GNAT family N-acetyltransferase [Candidatus Woesearchaeota archaeon]|jgi:ribosomal protein S18 acetylase RimI-like enzyme|nr:GNAT family N-acetyltransferase [Candidatus Woesearchaeota archaeon]MBT4387686.1 GNAT family N-acetyltransferase [Candidatus Woesearchaeota archaeon]MBT4595951.1 GNAT family N-acetyltransferase [Candidatus Woesearchaeota archaeon]MBT5741081.1 GNAT family N-acetyltransferase [Candidatus Woesearchaeota archaeon]MBT6505345.1 GNAT family N-acetyltransferase [Candidatus Woesearchaeota archaeon]